MSGVTTHRNPAHETIDPLHRWRRDEAEQERTDDLEDVAEGRVAVQPECLDGDSSDLAVEEQREAHHELEALAAAPTDIV